MLGSLHRLDRSSVIFLGMPINPKFWTNYGRHTKHTAASSPTSVKKGRVGCLASIEERINRALSHQFLLGCVTLRSSYLLHRGLDRLVIGQGKVSPLVSPLLQFGQPASQRIHGFRWVHDKVEMGNGGTNTCDGLCKLVLFLASLSRIIVGLHYDFNMTRSAHRFVRSINNNGDKSTTVYLKHRSVDDNLGTNCTVGWIHHSMTQQARTQTHNCVAYGSTDR